LFAMNSTLNPFILLCLLLSITLAEVAQLNDDNFEYIVREGEWFILYDNAQVHKQEEQLWKDLDKYFTEEIAHLQFKVGRVDCDRYPDACYDRKIRTKDLPKRYHFFGTKKEKIFQVLSNKPTTPEDIVDNWYKILHGEDVFILNSKNFNQSISNGKKWLVEFFTRWCPGCNQLDPVWGQLATEAKLNDSFVVAKLDYVTYLEFMDRYSINSAPTIKLFDNGKIYTYKGAYNVMTKQSFIDFVNNPPFEGDVVETDEEQENEGQIKEEL